MKNKVEIFPRITTLIVTSYILVMINWIIESITEEIVRLRLKLTKLD